MLSLDTCRSKRVLILLDQVALAKLKLEQAKKHSKHSTKQKGPNGVSSGLAENEPNLPFKRAQSSFSTRSMIYIHLTVCPSSIKSWFSRPAFRRSVLCFASDLWASAAFCISIHLCAVALSPSRRRSIHAPASLHGGCSLGILKGTIMCSFKRCRWRQRLQGEKTSIWHNSTWAQSHSV